MDYLPFIKDTVLSAGDLLGKLRAEDSFIEEKEGDRRNIVTEADRKVDAFIVEKIKSAYPDHAIYSEEGGSLSGKSAFEWVIDPIDGTANFSRAIPHYAVSVGILENGVPLAGAVYNPVSKECFSFARGEGAFLNETRIAVSKTRKLSDSWVLLHAGRRGDLQDWGGESYRKLLGAARKTGNLGSTSLDTCFVAAGRVEASVYGTYSTMDSAAALGILKEAGGLVSLSDGSEPAFSHEAQKIFVANNEAVLKEVRELLG